MSAFLTLAPDEIIVDSFAGGGGASLGIELAVGRSPDVAINHDREAVAMHAANHPAARHYCEDVWQVDPVEACAGRPVGLMWLSPDCKHFSKAKGGKPVSKKIRALAWVATRWAKAVRPRVMVLENVEEFVSWGPVAKATGKPCPRRKGQTFRKFVGRLVRLGYDVQWRELRACDFGAPTSRKRFYLVARCDAQPIVWPAPTHGKGRAHAWRTAAECLDWTLPCPSIFLTADEGKAIGVRRPLADATMRRIARGVDRYVLSAARPFVVEYHSAKRAGDDRVQPLDAPLPTQTTENRFALATPVLMPIDNRSNGDAGARSGADPLSTITAEARHSLVTPLLVPRYGERAGQAPRAMQANAPMPTIVPTQNGASLVSAFLAKHYTGVVGETPLAPMPTVTAIDHHALVTSNLVQLNRNCDGRPSDAPLGTVTSGGFKFAEVRAFLVAYYGNEKDGADLLEPMRTVTATERFGVVTVAGEDYIIADIGMRMLAPRELFRAQGFPDSYRIDVEFNGKPLTKTAQVRMCGNSVCPDVAAALVRAQFGGAVAVEPPRRQVGTPQLELMGAAA